jgi:sialidase-1
MLGLRLLTIFGGLLTPLPALESFDALPAGALVEQRSSDGKFSADVGHASVLGGKGRSGGKALHLVGGENRGLTFDFDAPTTERRSLDLWAERWTSAGDFQFRIEVKNGERWTELKRENGVKVGGFLTHVQAEVPVGVSALRFICTSKGGVLLDDVSLARSGPMKVLGLATRNPVIPVLRRKAVNPVLGFTLTTEGNQKPAEVEAVELSFDGTTRVEDIERIEILQGSSDPSSNFGKAIAVANSVSSSLVLKPNHPLASGENTFWVSVRLKDRADIDGCVSVSLKQVKVAGKVIVPEPSTSKVRQRIGVALRLRGDDGSNSYRIPGMAKTKVGTLLAVYDIRYNGCGDLPAKIDVGVSRSTDGGQSWGDMSIAMHPGTMGARYDGDGNGDPAILVDQQTGRIWVAAFWSHGNHGWNSSRPGMSPDETGQLLLAHSDDDGVSWSELRNITAAIKDPAWRLVFNGPGAGICLKDGTLVFPAQFRAADGGETLGKPFSTILSSKDHGQTWSIGTGARSDTTEAQVVELQDGSLMLNCRDNRGGSRTVMVTKDLGRSWTPHSTDRGALPEPVCMASLLRWDHPQHGPLFVFSNPASTSERRDMTLKISKDDAASWPQKWHTLYDSRNGSGYSCVAPADNEHIGILYEGICELYFMRLPLDACLK